MLAFYQVKHSLKADQVLEVDAIVRLPLDPKTSAARELMFCQANLSVEPHAARAAREEADRCIPHCTKKKIKDVWNGDWWFRTQELRLWLHIRLQLDPKMYN